jgi:hypothetical protein
MNRYSVIQSDNTDNDKTGKDKAGAGGGKTDNTMRAAEANVVVNTVPNSDDGGQWCDLTGCCQD